MALRPTNSQRDQKHNPKMQDDLIPWSIFASLHAGKRTATKEENKYMLTEEQGWHIFGTISGSCHHSAFDFVNQDVCSATTISCGLRKLF